MRKINDKKLLDMIQSGKTQKEIAEHFGVSPAAVCKRLKRLQLPPSVAALTEKERRFAFAVSMGKSKTIAAMDAYNCKSAASAKSFGHNLMKRDDINKAIQDIMAEEGLTRRHRLQRLKSHVDNQDPGVSLKALDQSWKLDGSYAPEKHLIGAQIQEYQDLSPELKAVIKKAADDYAAMVARRVERGDDEDEEDPDEQL